MEEKKPEDLCPASRGPRRADAARSSLKAGRLDAQEGLMGQFEPGGRKGLACLPEAFRQEEAALICGRTGLSF